MSKYFNVLAATLLVIGGVIFFQGINNLLVFEQGFTFSDSYPYQNNWSNNGTYDNTETDSNGDLVIVNIPGTGNYYSNASSYGDRISVEEVFVEADNLMDTGTNQRNASITVEALWNGALVESRTYALESGLQVFTPNFTETEYNGYRFSLHLESDSSNEESPEIGSVEVEGDYFVDVDGGNLPIELRSFFIVLMMLGGVYWVVKG